MIIPGGRDLIERGHNKTEVMKQAAIIVAEDEGWCPLFFMIDKSRAELNAILTVWPNMCVRICQFHVVQVRHLYCPILFKPSCIF